MLLGTFSLLQMGKYEKNNIAIWSVKLNSPSTKVLRALSNGETVNMQQRSEFHRRRRRCHRRS